MEFAFLHVVFSHTCIAVHLFIHTGRCGVFTPLSTNTHQSVYKNELFLCFITWLSFLHEYSISISFQITITDIISDIISEKIVLNPQWTIQPKSVIVMDRCTLLMVS